MNLPNIHPIISQIAETITRMLDRGFTADASLCHFIDSTFACPDAAELVAILADNDNCDTDSLIDLILSPDLPQQLEMEALLDAVSSSPSALKKLNANDVLALLPDSFDTALYVPDQNCPPIPFCVSKAAVTGFVKRFHLFYTIPPDVRNSLMQRFPEKESRLEALVIIRQFTINLTDDHRRLLLQYIDNAIHLDSNEFMACLSQLLTLFSRPASAPDFLAELTAEKEACRRQIEQTDQVEKQLAGKNMETLMLQGQRGFLSVDKTAVQQKIDRLDSLGRILFGRMPAPMSGQESPFVHTFSFEKEPGQ